MSLKEKLLETQKQFKESAPQEAVEIIHRAVQALDRPEIMDSVLKAGDPMPAFELPDASGGTVRSAEMSNKGPVALYFYRGIW